MPDQLFGPEPVDLVGVTAHWIQTRVEDLSPQEAEGAQDRCVTNENLDTLLIALHVKIDDELETHRWTGRPPQLTDSELVVLTVAPTAGYTAREEASSFLWRVA